MQKQESNNGMQTKVLSNDPEIRAHIYQQIMEFQPYITSKTLIEIIAHDQELDQEEETTAGPLPERVLIRLTEGESKLEAEGAGETIFIAISEAKRALLRELIRIQDEVVSSTDRHRIINSILSNQQSH